MPALPWLHPDRANALLDALRERILIIDGAMGTMIQRHGLQEDDYRGERFAGGYDHAHGPGCDHGTPEGHDLKGNNDLLLLTRPQVIADIHTAYLDAGADLVETNTFNATSVSQADYHLEHLVYELNKAGAAVARACCDAVAAATPGKPRFVIGVIGPTSRTASISPDVNDPGFRNTSFDELRDTYREAIEGLIDGGADTLMVETIFDTLNAKAALYALEEAFDARGARLPVMISGTITDVDEQQVRSDDQGFQAGQAGRADRRHGRRRLNSRRAGSVERWRRHSCGLLLDTGQGARRQPGHGAGDRTDVVGGGAAAAADQVQQAILGEAAQGGGHLFRRFVVLAEGVGQARVGVRADVTVGDLREGLHVRAHRLGAQRAVQADRQRARMRQ